MSNTRKKEITTNTTVGYNYIKSQYYVTNKGYTTYRTTAEEIRKVLNSLNIPDTEEGITDAELQALKEDIEKVNVVYYTWNESGSYIHTLQFNDWENYPLTIDCEKGKLYIMNTDIVYDLEIDESPRKVRIPYLCSYYKNKVGLSISIDDMEIYYNTLVQYYHPHVYVEFTLETTDEDKHIPKYSNKFVLSNYDSTSPAVYSGTYNYFNKPFLTDVGEISSIDSTTKTIYSLDTLPLEDNPIQTEVEGEIRNVFLQAGDKITLTGTTQSLDNFTTTADGTYTISSLTNNSIEVEESTITSYQYPFYSCNLVVATAYIHTIESETNTIEFFDNVPSNINIGDTIYISGTTQTVGYSTLSCDGAYTVQTKYPKENGQKNKKAIVVVEQLPYDYETEHQDNSVKVHKETYLGDIKTISTNTISLTKPMTFNKVITANSQITIRKPDQTYNTYLVNENVPVGSSEIKTTSNPTETLPTYPVISKILPETETLIDTTTSSLDNFPVGEFLLNSFEQACEYIETSTENQIEIPTEDILNSILSGEVEKTHKFYNNQTTSQCSDMKYKGIYSDIYKE